MFGISFALVISDPRRVRKEKTMNNIKLGDTVCYTADWLRSVGDYAGPLGQARGTVTALRHLGESVTIATVRWDRPDVPTSINITNLERTRP
jgi:hypothetical protein